DFSKPTGRTKAHTSAKPTITRKIPHLEAGALTTFFCPAACLRAFTKANEKATQQRKSSTRATIWSTHPIVFRRRHVPEVTRLLELVANHGPAHQEARTPSRDRYGLAERIGCTMMSPETTNSTRRFTCRPAGVSFEATGRVFPNPTAPTAFMPTPCCTR